MFSAISLWEAQVLLWVQTFLRNPVTDPVVSLFTQLGNAGLLFIGLTILLLLYKPTRKIGLAAALGLVFSLIFTNLTLKLIFQRARPWVDFPALIPLVAEHDPNSFPSGHTSAAFAFAVATFPGWPKRWMKAAALLAALLMGLSRLYVGVHYPTDVLVGALVGAAAGACGCHLSKFIQTKIGKTNS